LNTFLISPISRSGQKQHHAVTCNWDSTNKDWGTGKTSYNNKRHELYMQSLKNIITEEPCLLHINYVNSLH
jgi:hypothetical protein